MKLLPRRRPDGYRDTYLTPDGHRQEAERLAWVLDGEIQSGARRSLGDLIALARLHLELSRAQGAGQQDRRPS